MTFEATRNIKAGESLTVSYVDTINEHSSFKLYVTYGFVCKCDICERNKKLGAKSPKDYQIIDF